MKNILLLTVATLLAVGCSSSSKQEDSLPASDQAKYQIIDQEFDNLLAPESGYDNIPSYQSQLGTIIPTPSTVKKGAQKPARKSAGKPAVQQAPVVVAPAAAPTVDAPAAAPTAEASANDNLPPLDAYNEPLPDEVPDTL